MIIEGIASDKRNFFWTLFHVMLGVICTYSPFALIVWFYFVFIADFNKALLAIRRGKVFFFIFYFFYLISFELLDRMAKTSPYLPYELGKYFLVIVGCIGIVVLRIRNFKGFLLVLLLIPGLFYDDSGIVNSNDIINSFFAPVSIGLGIAFITKLEITEFQLNQLLKVLWLTCLSSLVFTILKTPDLDEVSFSLKAQFETTGGHSSNQVSTILGFGMFLSFYSIQRRLKFSGYYFLDVIFAALFAFQGLLSFSRGGMLVGLVAIIILFYERIKRNFAKSLIVMSASAVLLSGTFFIANQITGGMLLLRYQGETAATFDGRKEKTADVLTSGRVSIFNSDIEIWLSSPFLGTGCGSSKYMRDDTFDQNVAAHIEFSRLLAEHGIFGFFYFILLLFVAYKSIFSIHKSSSTKNLFIALSFIAIASTFHAAMRTYVTPMLVLITVLNVRKADEKGLVYRSN